MSSPDNDDETTIVKSEDYKNEEYGSIDDNYNNNSNSFDQYTSTSNVDSLSTSNNNLSRQVSNEKNISLIGSSVISKIDKRKRNCLASARFRQKKKAEMQMLEEIATQKSEECEKLNQKVNILQAEVVYLKQLILQSTIVQQNPYTLHATGVNPFLSSHTQNTNLQPSSFHPTGLDISNAINNFERVSENRNSIGTPIPSNPSGLPSRDSYDNSAHSGNSLALALSPRHPSSEQSVSRQSDTNLYSSASTSAYMQALQQQQHQHHQQRQHQQQQQHQEFMKRPHSSIGDLHTSGILDSDIGHSLAGTNYFKALPNMHQQARLPHDLNNF